MHLVLQQILPLHFLLHPTPFLLHLQHCSSVTSAEIYRCFGAQQFRLAFLTAHDSWVCTLLRVHGQMLAVTVKCLPER